MAIELIAKVAPKNDGFTGMVDADQVLGGGASGTLPAATIADETITYAKMQHVSATDKVLGRVTAGAGDVEEIACTAAGRALIDDAHAAAQRTTLGLVIGTDVLAEQTIGIADNNLLEVDDADAADDDYAKFTAAGLEGRSYAEVLSDIGVTAGADVTADNAPQAHKASHENAGGDEISVAGLSGLLADDQHVLDAEVQAIKLDDFATPDDNTDLNASTTAHGLLLKLDNNPTHFLNGQGAWHALVESDITDLGSYLENIVEDTTPQLGGNLDANSKDITGATKIDVDNLRLDGNTITSIDANGDLIFDTNGTGEMLFKLGGSEKVRIATGGQVGIGTDDPAGWAATSMLAIVNEATYCVVDIIAASNTPVHSPYLKYRRCRGTVGVKVKVESGDRLAFFAASGWDGSNWKYHGNIKFEVDGATSAGVVPTAFIVRTGTTVAVDRLTIGSDGDAVFTGDVNVAGNTTMSGNAMITGSTNMYSGVGVQNITGIVYTPGSDRDMDLINVTVTGTPKLWWDESEDEFATTKHLNIAGGWSGTFTNGDADTVTVKDGIITGVA